MAKQVAKATRPTIKVGASTGMVFCNKCGVIRNDDGTLYDICHICEEGKWQTTNDIDVTKYGPDIIAHRKQIMDKLTPWELAMPDNVEITLLKADQATGIDRMSLIMQAHVKAESYYYSSWAQGDIAAKKKRMPDDVKDMLRNRNKGIMPVKEDELARITKAQVRAATKTQLRNLYWAIYGADAGPNITEPRMRESIIGAIEEREAAKKRPTEVEASSDTPIVAKPQTKAPKNAKVAKLPTFKDPKGQAEREAKYSWAKKGTWREDPDHTGATIVDIVCIKCGSPRTVHLADLFQVKTCVACKKSSKASK